jgi:hypothetical protein
MLLGVEAKRVIPIPSTDGHGYFRSEDAFRRSTIDARDRERVEFNIVTTTIDLYHPKLLTLSTGSHGGPGNGLYGCRSAGVQHARRVEVHKMTRPGFEPGTL